jgi:hypothetical protein
MAFIKNNLQRIGGVANKGAYVYYAGTDTKATVEASGYFNNAASLLAVGDKIMILADTYTMNVAVLTNDGTTVTTSQRIAQAFRLPDASSKAADAAVTRFVAPFAGTITKVRAVLNAALAAADGTVTTAINGTGVTGGVVTLTQAASAAGSQFSASPSALNTVAAGDVITLTVGGGSTATATAGLQIEILPT